MDSLLWNNVVYKDYEERQVIVTPKGADGFFRVVIEDIDWRIDSDACLSFIALLKEFWDAENRDFDPDAKQWSFENDKYSSVLALARSWFPGRVKDE